MKIFFSLVVLFLIASVSEGFLRRNRHRNKPRTINQRIKSIFGQPVKRIDYCVCNLFGDPHIKTFDGLTYHFQSVCRFNAATVPDAPKNCGFSIDGQNYIIGNNKRVSWIHYMIVNMFGTEFRLHRGPRIQVNGRFVPAYKTADVSITIVNRRIIFESARCGVKIFTQHYGDSVVYVDKGRYGRKVKGVCGNCDGNAQNDWRTRDGRSVKPTGGLYNAEAIGRSWAVPSDDGRICLGAVQPSPGARCNGQALLTARALCAPLLNKKNVFKACIDKRVMNTYTQMHDQCVTDACALGANSHMFKKLLCVTAKLISDKCLAGGVGIPTWRQTFNCPAPKPPPTVDTCSLPVDKGPCRGAHARFFFNMKTGTCQYYLYGGCGGNKNRFETYTDCVLRCGGKKKPTPNGCSTNEVTVTLLQKLRVLMDQVKRPTTDLSYLVPVSHMMQQSIAQFQVIMRLFIQIRQMKQQQNMIAKYMNLRQMIAQLLMVVKRGINHRYIIPSNPFIRNNNGLILRIVESFKLMNKVYIGQEKTDIFVRNFDRVNSRDNELMFRQLTGLMNVRGKLDLGRIDALKVMVPTFLMSGLEKMGRIGFQGDMHVLDAGFTKELQQVQLIATAMKQRVIETTKITIH